MGPSMFLYCVTCTMSLLLCTTGSFSYQIFYFTRGTFNMLMNLCEKFEGCPWDLGTESSVGCSCSCTSELLHIWLSSIVCIIDVCTLMHMLYFRPNFQCQRFKKPSTSSGIVICRSSQRCVIVTSFSGLLKAFYEPKR